MCAMEEEASFMRDRMNDCSEVPLTGAMRRTRGSIGGMAVDLVVSGIGTDCVRATLELLLSLRIEVRRHIFAPLTDSIQCWFLLK